MTQLIDRLDAWVSAGLLHPDQAEAIRRHEGTIVIPDEAPEARSTLAAEAVGYLGASLAIIAGGLVVSRYWERIEPWGRLSLLSLLAFVTFAAGWWIRDRQTSPPVDRLVSVLWAATAVAAGFAAGVLAGDVLPLEGADVVQVVAGVVLLVGGPLYLVHERTLQHLVLAWGIVLSAVMLVVPDRGGPDVLAVGGLLWALGMAWFLLSAGGWLLPARTGQVLGLLGLGVGVQVASVGDHRTAALTVALLTTGAALGAGVAGRSTLLLAGGVAGTFVFVPQLVEHLFGDSLGTPFVLFVTGIVLIGVAVGSIRLRAEFIEEVAT